MNLLSPRYATFVAALKMLKTSTGTATTMEAFFSRCRPALLLLKIDNLKLKRERECNWESTLRAANCCSLKLKRKSSHSLFTMLFDRFYSATYVDTMYVCMYECEFDVTRCSWKSVWALLQFG